MASCLTQCLRKLVRNQLSLQRVNLAINLAVLTNCKSFIALPQNFQAPVRHQGVWRAQIPFKRMRKVLWNRSGNGKWPIVFPFLTIRVGSVFLLQGAAKSIKHRSHVEETGDVFGGLEILACQTNPGFNVVEAQTMDEIHLRTVG